MKTIIQNLWLLLFLLSAASIRSFSQAPEIEWQKSFGGTGNENGFAAAIPTTDGGYIVAGDASSTNGQVHGNHGNEDFWIVKLNSSGDTLWTKTFGGSNTDQARSIKQTRDGGYVVAGRSNSINGDITFNHGGFDYWALKLNTSGNIVWQKTYGGSGDEIAYSIEQTSEGGFVLAGLSYSNDGDVTGNHGAGDYWALKLDSLGVIEWQNALGGSAIDGSYCIKQTTDGGYVMTGFTGSIDGDVHHNNNVLDLWIVKLNSVGDTVWTRTYGGPNYDQGAYIRETFDGGFIVIGHATVNGGDVHGVHGNSDFWIVKINSLGDTLWTKALGGSNYDYGNFIQQTSDSGYILVGHGASADFDFTGSHGSFYYDVLLVKLDASGNTIWTKIIGGTYTDIAIGSQSTTDCGYILSGWSESNDFDIIGNHGNVGSYDFWVMKIAADPTLFKTFYADNDGDGYGDAGSTTLSCSAQNGYVSNSTDCNDAFASVHPNATETCNGVDDNCNIQIDEGVKSTFYADADGDSYGNVGVKTKACVAPLDYVSNSTDCDDANAAIHPGAEEICNGTDDNCDAQIDEGVKSTFYADSDGYGNMSVTTEACSDPSGYVSNSTDCDDTNAAIQPAATEVCNGIDDNCNNQIDEACLSCEIPVALSTKVITETSAKLKWAAMSTAVRYKLRYKIANTPEWITIHPTVNHKTVDGLTANTEYTWQVKSICGSQPIFPSEWSEKDFFTTGALRLSEGPINGTTFVAEDFFAELYPNPVIQYAVISFSLHAASDVLIRILDINGRVLRLIADETFSEGNHEVTFHRESLGDGIYLVQMQTNEGVMIKKMVIHQ